MGGFQGEIGHGGGWLRGWLGHVLKCCPSAARGQSSCASGTLQKLVKSRAFRELVLGRRFSASYAPFPGAWSSDRVPLRKTEGFEAQASGRRLRASPFRLALWTLVSPAPWQTPEQTSETLETIPPPALCTHVDSVAIPGRARGHQAQRRGYRIQSVPCRQLEILLPVRQRRLPALQ